MMNKGKLFFVLIAVLVGVIAAGWFNSTKTKEPHQRTAALTAQDKKDVYYCPMHPTYTSDKPGDCPICNMKLVKKEKTSPIANKQVGAQDPHSICYLHNCPMMHDGKPCPMTVVAKEGEEVTCPICGSHVSEKGAAKGEKKVLYWTDPMIPGYKSDKPGKSPMGMDLVAVYEEEAGLANTAAPEGYTPVLVTPQKQQLIGIRTAPVERRKLTKTIRAVGTVAHDPELYQAQVEYIQAMQALGRAQQSSIPEVADQASRLVESTRIRLKHMGLSDDLIAEMATWKEAEHSLLFAHPGEPVWVYAQIYEYELPLVHIGQKLTAEVPSISDKTFEGMIRAIDLMVDPATRTTRIRGQLQDPDGKLKPDMYVNVSIGVDLGEVLALPEEALFDTGTKKIIFVDKGQGIFEPRDVVVAAKADNFYELKSGAQDGEKVVTSGNFLIDSESRLKSALEDMTTDSGVHQHAQ